MHQVKVTTNVEIGVPFDFDFSDEIGSFGFPYIYFLQLNYIKILSPVTNQEVKVIDFGPKLIKHLDDNKLKKTVLKYVKPEDYKKGVFSLYTNIYVPHYMECYLSSSNLDCSIFLRLIDKNADDQVKKFKILDKQ